MVDIIGRAKVIVESQIDKSSIDQTGGKIGKSLKAGAIVGVAALGTVATASFKMYQSFETAEAQSRKLNQVLDNMGESKAGPAVEELATKISRLTGVEDELIQQGQTILATFSEVAESAGNAGGVFERATKAAVDLSATGFGSVESASVMLGKALQNPVKGITALSRSGVTFTEEQKKVIESLVETGDVAGAQALILEEVEQQVGGTAEASATASQKIQTAMGEAGEALGNVLDTLAGNKTEEGAKGKSLSERIDAATDSLNKFAESEGLKEFTANLEETSESEFFQNLKDRNAEVVEDFGETLLFISNIPERLDAIKADIDDGGLWDGASDQLEAWEKDLGRGLRNMKTRIGDTIDDIKDTGKEWGEAGKKLIGDFLKGFAAGPVPFQLGQKVKDAINKALPNTITFFGGRGGIPAITVDVPQFASGVRNFGGGLALVGERGPELVGLPRGSDVYSNQESSRMVAGGGTVITNYNLFGPESLSQARRDNDWDQKYGTRFGAATQAAAL